MFRHVGYIGGDGSPLISDYPISAGADIREGALVRVVPGSGLLSVAPPASLANAILGVAARKSTSADTFTELPVIVATPADLWEVDIEEILKGVVLTATGGSATTFVDSSLQGASDDSLIGTVVEVVSMASGDQPVGTLLTVTDYARSTGTLTFPSLGATGFAAGDRIRIKELGATRPIGETQLLPISTGENFQLDSAGGGDLFRVLYVSGDRKKVVGQIIRRT